MNGSLRKPSGAFRRTLEYLQQRRDASSLEAERRHLTIAISRQHGARGSQVAQAIGRRLGWQVYDGNLVEEITSDPELQATLSDTVDERHRSWIVECLEAFGNVTTTSDAAFVHRLVKVLLSLSSHGQCVIVGRGAGFRLPQEATVRVGLVASLKDRVARIAADHQISEHEATRRIKQVDHERRMFVKDHFHKDPSDMDHFDLILNTSRFSDEQCAQFVIEACARVDAEFEVLVASAG